MRILVILAFYIGIVLLQVFLSKRENKRLGLILPAICIVFSIILVLGGTPSYTSGELTMQELDANGTVITEEIIEEHQQPIVSTGSTVFQMFLSLLILNIPTAVLLAIYFGCREKIRRNKQIDKMNIQDLE